MLPSSNDLPDLYLHNVKAIINIFVPMEIICSDEFQSEEAAAASFEERLSALGDKLGPRLLDVMSEHQKAGDVSEAFVRSCVDVVGDFQQAISTRDVLVRSRSPVPGACQNKQGAGQTPTSRRPLASRKSEGRGRGAKHKKLVSASEDMKQHYAVSHL